jgi:DNA-binding transcriptional MerR regulator
MHADESKSNQRFTVKEAAQRLNVSEAAIRQRIQRETINYEKDEDNNRVYIILDDTENRLDNGESDIGHSSERELIDTLQEQLRLEREASAELRRIIAGLTQRIPAIEAPEPSESPVTASGDRGNGEVRPEQEKRSWWRRWFG